MLAGAHANMANNAIANTVTMAELTIEFFEQRLTHKKFCAYCRMFHGIDAFIAPQMLARPAARYCKEKANPVQRGKIKIPAVPVLETSEALSLVKQIRPSLTVTDMPVVVSGREKRAALRTGAPAGPIDSHADDDLPPKKRTRTASGGGGTSVEQPKLPVLSDEALDAYFLANLSNLVAHDNNQGEGGAYFTELRDPGNRTLVDYELFPGTNDFNWTVALDDVRAVPCSPSAFAAPVAV